jgi:hypothetical protein
MSQRKCTRCTLLKEFRSYAFVFLAWGTYAVGARRFYARVPVNSTKLSTVLSVDLRKLAPEAVAASYQQIYPADNAWKKVRFLSSA